MTRDLGRRLGGVIEPIAPVPAGVTLRRADEADLGSIRGILASHGNDGAIVIADVVGPYVSHLIQHGRTFVAVLDEMIVGVGAAIDTGRSIHLADLFVDPAHLGRGIGRALLDAVMGEPGPRTTFASDDPRALPLYVRAGMTPLWPCLYLQGAAARLPGRRAGLVTEDASPSDLAALEQAWTGIDRAGDHAHWGAMPQADQFVIRDGGDVIAFGYARARQIVPTRMLHRLVSHPGADPVAATLAALLRTGRDGGQVMVSLPGPHPALRPLLDAGIRIADHDQFMASDPSIVDPVLLIPDAGTL